MYKRGFQVYMFSRRLAFVELSMADMRVGWVPSLDCRFFLARYHTGVVGDFHGHFEASQYRVFLLFLLKYPLFGLLEDSRLIVPEKAVCSYIFLGIQ